MLRDPWWKTPYKNSLECTRCTRWKLLKKCLFARRPLSLLTAASGNQLLNFTSESSQSWLRVISQPSNKCSAQMELRRLSSSAAQGGQHMCSSDVAQHTSVDASVLLGRLLAPAQLNILTDFSLFRNLKQLMGS